MTQIVNMIGEWQTNQNITHPTVSFFRNVISSGSTNHSIIPAWLQLCRKNAPASIDCFTAFAMTGEENLAMTGNGERNFETNRNSLDLGFHNGLAGLGLSLISVLNGDDSWISLFPNDL